MKKQNGSPAEQPNSRWTRRAALRHLTAGALLSMGMWPGCTHTPKHGSHSPFRFMVVNDTHYMSEECGPWLLRVVEQMKTHPDAEFCLLVGDLVETGNRPDLEKVSEIFASLGLPVYFQIGNHDYLSDTDRSAYEAVFPNQINYWFEHRGWQFVGFDSTQGTQYQGTEIQSATLGWLRDTVPQLSRSKPTVVFTHFPLGAGVTYRPRNADDALDFFRGHNLKAVFNGHFHGRTEREWNFTPVLTNKCCALKRGNHDGTQEKGYLLCTARDGILSNEFVAVSS